MGKFSSILVAVLKSVFNISLKNFNEIHPVVKNHLIKVYLLLCCALPALAFGAYLSISKNIGGLLDKSETVGVELKGVSLLMAFSFIKGASIAPLVQLDILSNLRILVRAFMETVFAFACFSVAAMLAKPKEYPYLQGLISFGSSIMWCLNVASIFFKGSSSLFMFEMGFSLLVFGGRTLFDTQEIIKNAHDGDLDYAKHALTLSTIFIIGFTPILKIRLKNAYEKKGRGETKGDHSMSHVSFPIVKKLTCSEVAARRAQGLCYSCDKFDTPGHQCKKLFWIKIDVPLPIVKKLTCSEVATRRAQGLCYSCDEFDTPGHQCKKLFWIKIEEGEANEAQRNGGEPTLPNYLL